jgi:CelD/BcsL family acetyltransferase involved in cellulose biosynthesis
VLLELDGRAIAFQYYFAFAGTMFVHRLAFDPAYAAFSPGVLVTLRAVEEASREGLQRVEFLRGEEPYKLQLADHVEDVLWVACLPQGLRGQLRARRRIAELRIRQRAKASGGLHRAYQGVVKRRSRSSSERA